MLLASVRHLAYLKHHSNVTYSPPTLTGPDTNLDILKWDDPSWLLVSGKFKIVKTIVIQYEPSPLPALVPPTLLPQPALLVWIEESVHQVVSIVLGDLEGLSFDAENFWNVMRLHLYYSALPFIQRHKELPG